MRCSSVVLLFLAALVPAAPSSSSQSELASQQPTQPTFRSPVVVVPVDVRVIDNKTQTPVTDLKAEDFTVLENGVRQELRLFLYQRWADTTDGANPAITSGVRPAPAGAPLTFSPQPNRVFLFVLGRGRLQEPSKGLDAAIDFVRTRLLPRDQVAVLAYNRATAFSRDHDHAAGVIERFRQENDAIDGELRFALSGLAGVYGSRELPRAVQARIDRVFAGGAALPTVTAGAENTGTADRMRRDDRNAAEAAIQAVVDSGRLTLEGVGSLAPASGMAWGEFDQFVERTASTLQDTGNMFAAITYLQRIEGEKHLVFVTEDGLRLRRQDDEEDLAHVAADSRVAIDVIQTGGVIDPLTARAQRNLSESSGGMASVSEYSRPALNRLDAATRSSYLLGYYPSDSRSDNAFRSITVRVNRPNVRLVYRRGYYGRAVSPVFDRVEYATRFRMEGAATFGKDIADIGVTAAASLAKANGSTVVDVSARIDPAALHFEVRDGIHLGRVTVAVVPMDAGSVIIGGRYKRQVAHLEYDDQTLELVRRIGIPYDARLPVPPNTRFVRVIVYDAAADLIGSVLKRVQ